MRIPSAAWGIIKEITRHVLRRPVVGICAAAQVPDGRWLLVRRGDTGGWALPGGTLEWGEPLQQAVRRELEEEAGVQVRHVGTLCGVYSAPWRDARFHAVTVIVRAQVELPNRPPMNGLEITEVGLFEESELPQDLSYGMTEMLRNAVEGRVFWE